MLDPADESLALREGRQLDVVLEELSSGLGQHDVVSEFELSWEKRDDTGQQPTARASKRETSREY